MTQSNVTISPVLRDSYGGQFTIWEVQRNGEFVIGGQTEAEAQRRLRGLDTSGWKYLDCHQRGYPSPLGWIDHVREQNWTFDHQCSIKIGKDGRAFFGGNINEYSASFNYLILDQDILQQVIGAAPEIPVIRA